MRGIIFLIGRWAASVRPTVSRPSTSNSAYSIRCAIRRFCFSGSVMPYSRIASLMAASASGASTWPMISAGVPRMRAILQRYNFRERVECGGIGTDIHAPVIQLKKASACFLPARPGNPLASARRLMMYRFHPRCPLAVLSICRKALPKLPTIPVRLARRNRRPQTIRQASSSRSERSEHLEGWRVTLRYPPYAAAGVQPQAMTPHQAREAMRLIAFWENSNQRADELAGALVRLFRSPPAAAGLSGTGAAIDCAAGLCDRPGHQVP